MKISRNSFINSMFLAAMFAATIAQPMKRDFGIISDETISEYLSLSGDLYGKYYEESTTDHYGESNTNHGDWSFDLDHTSLMIAHQDMETFPSTSSSTITYQDSSDEINDATEINDSTALDSWFLTPKNSPKKNNKKDQTVVTNADDVEKLLQLLDQAKTNDQENEASDDSSLHIVISLDDEVMAVEKEKAQRDHIIIRYDDEEDLEAFFDKLPELTGIQQDVIHFYDFEPGQDDQTSTSYILDLKLENINAEIKTPQYPHSEQDNQIIDVINPEPESKNKKDAITEIKFECICGKEFSRKCNLAKHQKSCDGILEISAEQNDDSDLKRNACPHCLTTFTRECALTNHLQCCKYNPENQKNTFKK